MPEVCIPKLFCINTYLLVSMLIGIIIFMWYSKKEIKSGVVDSIGMEAKKEEGGEKKEERANNLFDMKTYSRLYDILVSPERTYQSSSLPRNYQYQQVGVVQREESNPDFVATGENIFRLFGRPNQTSNDKWDYYVTTKDGLKIPLGERISEKYDGEEISIKGYNGVFKVTIYPYEEFRYDPYNI